ncbi:RCC1 domain-containing protein [Endothiovibrio diazotrophicus]
MESRSVSRWVALLLAMALFHSPSVYSRSLTLCLNGAMALGDDGLLYQWRGGTSWDSWDRMGTPLPVLGLYDIGDFSCGPDSSLAVDRQGVLYGWGVSYYGVLGPEVQSRGDLIAEPLAMLDDVAKVESSDFGMALRRDGTVWVWGGRFAWWLDDPQHASQETLGTPVQVEGLDSVVDIAAPGYLTIYPAEALALKADGTVWSWGVDQPTPAQVEGLTEVVAIDTFGSHHVALRADGTVWTWGSNEWGLLGIGAEEPHYDEAPHRVADLDGVVAIAAGDYHVLALRADGSVWGWGDNASNELNTPDLDYSLQPIRVPGIAGAVEIAAGGGNSMVKLSDGRVLAWGANGTGAIDPYAYLTDPVYVLDGSDLVEQLGLTEIPGFGSTPTPPAGAPPTPWLDTEVDGHRVTLTWGMDGVEPSDNDRFTVLYALFPAAAPVGQLFFRSEYRLEVELPSGSAYYVLVYRDGMREGVHYQGVTPYSNIEIVSVP